MNYLSATAGNLLDHGGQWTERAGAGVRLRMAGARLRVLWGGVTGVGSLRRTCPLLVGRWRRRARRAVARCRADSR
ncbi:MAG: hypothetical protein M3Z25_22250, partial [Actinomycetota bacterium]|nr:hypothetical protein [Actinomycetota bacterium]